MNPLYLLKQGLNEVGINYSKKCKDTIYIKDLKIPIKYNGKEFVLYIDKYPVIVPTSKTIKLVKTLKMLIDKEYYQFDNLTIYPLPSNFYFVDFHNAKWLFSMKGYLQLDVTIPTLVSLFSCLKYVKHERSTTLSYIRKWFTRTGKSLNQIGFTYYNINHILFVIKYDNSYFIVVRQPHFIMFINGFRFIFVDSVERISKEVISRLCHVGGDSK